MRKLRLGTRGSKLALRQAELAVEALQAATPGTEVEISAIATTGDRAPGIPLSQITETSFFTKEIEQALLAGSIDIAVHSCKDLASRLPDGLEVGAVLPRENPCDALLSHLSFSLDDLPRFARIGTSSPRRTAQLKALRPDLVVLPLRGNVETRISKMKDAGFDAILLAYAGIARLGLTEFVTQVLPPEVMVPAPGQGAIAIEIRGDDAEMKGLLERVHDAKTGREILAERAFLRALQAGCRAPVGCLAQADGGSVAITGMIASTDGQRVFKEIDGGSVHDPECLGAALAERLLAAGGRELLEIFR